MAVLDILSRAFQTAADPFVEQLSAELDRMFRANLQRALIDRLEIGVTTRGASNPKVTMASAPVPRERRQPRPRRPQPVVSPEPTVAAAPALASPAAPAAERIVRAPIVIRLPPKRRRAERRSADQLETLQHRILKTLGAHPDQRLEAIADAVGAPRGSLAWPINRLIAAQKVVAAGEPGASVYSLAPPPAPTVTRIIRRPAASVPKLVTPAS